MYRVPAEPSSRRVAVWRRLKAMGALYLQNAVALLPEVSRSVQFLQGLRREVEQAGGEAFLLRAACLEAGGDDALRERFRQERDAEYAEVLERCAAFRAELEMETRRANFTYGELEENEEDLHRLRKWYAKVRRRDFFGAASAARAAEELARCAALLEEFALRVYRAQDGHRE